MRTLISIGVAGLLLAGCAAPAADICATPPPLDPVLANKTDAASVTQLGLQCVHRWSYRLAGSSDPAPVVADAVMGACADLVFRTGYAQEMEAQTRNENPQGFDSFTGEEANRYVIAAREMRRQAIFHIVQARAGNCPAPG